MIRAEFTEDIGAQIVEQLPNTTGNVCGSVLRTVNSDGVTYVESDEWVPSSEACYAPVIGKLQFWNHPDHFGIPFLGESAPKKDYLDCLLNPESPFAGVLPYLWHKTPSEVLRDGGFVCINVMDEKCNAGLLWTFLQATRRLYEHRHDDQFAKIVEATKDRDIALALEFSLQPYGFSWISGLYLHGSPLGSEPAQYLEGFLKKKIIHVPDHLTQHSHKCFRANYQEQRNNNAQPLSGWISTYEEIRARKN